MNAIDIKIMKLYQEYLPFLPKGKCLYSYSDEYEQEGNIRLLFGYFRNVSIKKLENPTLFDMLFTSDDYKDEDFSTLLIENIKRYEEYNEISVDGRIDVDCINLNHKINGKRKHNFGFIVLNPFETKPDNMLENDFKEKERDFLIKQINILQPDAIIIPEYVDDGYADHTYDFNVKQMEKYRKLFGRDIIFYPIPFTSTFIKKYENGDVEDYVSHLSLIEGVEKIDTKIYIYKYCDHDDIDYIDVLLQILANHIINNTKKRKLWQV